MAADVESLSLDVDCADATAARPRAMMVKSCIVSIDGNNSRNKLVFC